MIQVKNQTHTYTRKSNFNVLKTVLQFLNVLQDQSAASLVCLGQAPAR
jgi:hypothetical protein